ncbi:MAG: hypothetical protein JXQ67_04165 [Campylobacterales bacterium]|nr:hypothetical protein [Campylobacterales bacterium]
MQLTLEAILYIIGGIVIGYFVSFLKSRFEVGKYKKELREYKEHLNRQMKITNEGNKNLEDELTRLKKESENLRVSLQTMSQKPGRSEIRLLNIYDGALRKMMMRAPGFAPAWEMSLQEAEKEYEENEKGFKSIIKKVFGPSLTQTQNSNVTEIAEYPEGFKN